MSRGGFRQGAGRPRKGEIRVKTVRVRGKRQLREKECAFCGEIYISKRYKYCSRECLMEKNKKDVFERNKNNPDKMKIYRKKEQVALNKRLKIKRRNDPLFALNSRISCLLRDGLKRTKNGRKWQDIVGYSINDLRQHIENQFKDDMSWDYFLSGKIHIDHKIPQSAFNYSCPDDPDFKKCWALKNLQPLWASDNIRKKDKLEKPFQPSLAIGVL